MYFVYVLLCEDQSLYTGSSNNIEKRFQAHLAGKGSKYTRSHKPVRIIFKETFQNKSEALKREIDIKSWSRQQKIDRLGLKITI